MTPATTCPLQWDGAGFRPVRDVLPDLAEWGREPPERMPPGSAMSCG